MPPERESDPHRDDLPFALRWLRALRAWKQSDFAEAAGIDVRTLQRYESGEQGVSEEALDRLLRAARLPASHFENVLLPALRVLRAAIAREEEDDPGAEESEEPLEEVAARVGREIAETVRAVVLEHYLNLDREEKERQKGSWYPTEADARAVPDLLGRLARYGEADRRFLIENARPFQSWALARHLADSVTEGAGHAVPAAFGSNLDRAALAVRVAQNVPGPEAWSRRMQGYAQAALARARRQAGDPAGARAAAAEAERLWSQGVDEAGALEETTFRKLVGTAGS